MGICQNEHVVTLDFGSSASPGPNVSNKAYLYRHNLIFIRSHLLNLGNILTEKITCVVSFPSFVVFSRAFTHPARAHSSFDVLLRTGEMPGAVHVATVRFRVDYNKTDRTKSPPIKTRLGSGNQNGNREEEEDP